MEEKIVVLGGNGFIGYSVVTELVKRHQSVRCVDYILPEKPFRYDEIEYCTGDIREKYFLSKVLDKATMVMDFIATTMPNTKDVSVVNEIDNTLRHHDYILSSMYQIGISRYVFPSSGGAIYGNIQKEVATESEKLQPTTPYGLGKLMTEDLIKYYFDKCGIQSNIFRIGNVYGSPRYRKKAQGVVDIFIQNAINDQTITIWGNAEQSIRDYIHLDDVSDAIVSTVLSKPNGVSVYNVGTGVGTSTKQLIDIIQSQLSKRIRIEYREEMASGLNRIVLSPQKIFDDYGWKAKITIEQGVARTIEEKKNLISATI